MFHSNAGELHQLYSTFNRVWGSGGAASLTLKTLDGKVNAVLELQLGHPDGRRPGAPEVTPQAAGSQQHGLQRRRRHRGPGPPPPPPPPPPAAPPRRLVTVVRNNRTSFCQLEGASPTSPSPSTPTPSPKPRRNETPMDCRDCGHDWEELIADDVSRRQHDDHLLETQRNHQLRFVEDGYAHDIKWETLLHHPVQWASAASVPS